MKSYTIIRINEDLGTVTAVLCVDGKELQQDVPVEDFGSKSKVERAILPFLDKLEEDLSNIQEVNVANTVRDLVDQEVTVE